MTRSGPLVLYLQNCYQRRQSLLRGFFKLVFGSSDYHVRRSVQSVGKFRRFTVVAVGTFCAWITFANEVGYTAGVIGGSMRPTLNDNKGIEQFKSPQLLGLDSDWVFINCWKAKKYKFERGDILVYVSPTGKLAGKKLFEQTHSFGFENFTINLSFIGNDGYLILLSFIPQSPTAT